MRLQFLTLAALAALAAGGAAQAQPASSVQSFVDRVQGEANARLADSGVSIAGAARIRFSVDSRGYVSAVRVLRSSGSSEADARIREALQQMHVDAVPADLLGANVMLEVTNEAFADARTP